VSDSRCALAHSRRSTGVTSRSAVGRHVVALAGENGAVAATLIRASRATHAGVRAIRVGGKAVAPVPSAAAKLGVRRGSVRSVCPTTNLTSPPQRDARTIGAGTLFSEVACTRRGAHP